MTTMKMMTRREILQAGAIAAVAGLARPWNGLAAETGRYQIGCYTRPWAKFDYTVALDGIAEAGYKYCGLMTSKTGLAVNVKSTPEEVAKVADEVKKRGLKTASIYCGDFNAAKSVEEGITGLKRLIDYSAMLGCPNLLLGGTGSEKVFNDYYKVVAECCDYAAGKNVGMTVKPHGGKNSTGPELRRIIEMVGHKSFRVTYDPGNIFYYSEGKLDPIQDAPTVDGLVAAMCVKDYLPPKRVDVTPGTGQVKFKEVLALLQKGGFTSGPMVVECTSPAEEPAQITAEAKKARQFLFELVGAEKAE